MKKNKLNDLDGKQWIKSLKSFYFSRKNKFDGPSLKHPAPFYYNDIERFILFFTKENGLVLDPFCGSGTSLIAAFENKRQSVGFDLKDVYKKLFLEKMNMAEKQENNKLYPRYIIGDARREIKKMNDDSLDYVITSPPYFNILKNKAKGTRKPTINYRNGTRTTAENYSSSEKDFSNLDTYNEFLNELEMLFIDVFLKIKFEKYLTIIISDFTVEKKEIHVIGDIVSLIRKIGFIFDGNVVLLQDNKSLYPFGYPYKYKINHHHQTAVMFHKPKAQ